MDSYFLLKSPSADMLRKGFSVLQNLFSYVHVPYLLGLLSDTSVLRTMIVSSACAPQASNITLW